MQFLADLRFSDASPRLDMAMEVLPMSPLLAAFVAEGRRSNVGREALSLACLLEAGAATFVPGKVACAWCRALQERAATREQSEDPVVSAAGHEGHDSQRSLAGLERDDPLMQLCNVLEDLNGFLWDVRVQMGVEGENQRKTMKHNLMEVKVSVTRLKKGARFVV